MTLDVYRGRKTTMQQQQPKQKSRIGTASNKNYWGACLPKKSVVRLIDRPDMTLGVYVNICGHICGRKTTIQQQQQSQHSSLFINRTMSFHTNFEYDNILDMFEFEHSRALLSLNWFQYNFAQMFSTNILGQIHVSVVCD